MQKIDKQAWESTCPVCEQDNQCSAADGKPVETCWCFSAQVDQAVLDALAPEDRGTRCLCAGCINGDKSRQQGNTTL